MFKKLCLDLVEMNVELKYIRTEHYLKSTATKRIAIKYQLTTWLAPLFMFM